MSNIIFTLESFFGDFFGDVQNSFSGRYSSRNEGIVELMNELKNTKIPTPKEDRDNLKKDASNVARDYRKAL